MRISIKVIPNSKNERVEEKEGIKVYVKASPEKGKSQCSGC